MDLKIKSNNNDITIPLLEEKLGGVELPYLHVKKGDKTWYIPCFKTTGISEYQQIKFIMYLKYKEAKYGILREWDYMGVAILKDEKLHLTTKLNRDGKTVIINKAEPLLLCRVIKENGQKKYRPVMEVNYGDILWIYRENRFRGTYIVNFTQNETILEKGPFIFQRKNK